MPTSEFSASINLLPPSTNPALVVSGPLALYNPTLILIATALSQNGIIFGIFFLLRGFSAKRVFDTHYLTFLLTIALTLTGLVFLIDPAFDSFKVFFFLDHEAIEVALALRILLPVKTCREYAGLILFCLWGALCTLSVAVSLSDFYSHGADIVAWGAFCSDFMLGVSGVVLIKRWFDLRPRLSHVSPTLREKAVAEGLAGMGFILHGFSSMCIGPIFTRVLYFNTDPNWFAYGFVCASTFTFFGLAFMIPAATMFFGTINWCCWHNRKVLPGQAQWEDEENGSREEVSQRKTSFRGGSRDTCIE
ncbi:hypothetical protein BKA65DRAFT_594398 [Rhexocercosporidium sp. MPI-PUGE-AT-0058]|nr:hypothetical protein BKA65DRAFT_594398 [Rhexocercosporidium sp. MPI-PUGE-AT-0058]